MNSVKQQCERGFQWILDNHPEWIDNVNLDNLNQRNIKKCIIGQNTNYWNIHNAKSEAWMINHGFYNDVGGEIYEEYTEEFKRLIVEHRQTGTSLLEQAKKNYQSSIINDLISLIDKNILESSKRKEKEIFLSTSKYGCIGSATLEIIQKHYTSQGFTVNNYTISGWA